MEVRVSLVRNFTVNLCSSLSTTVGHAVDHWKKGTEFTFHGKKLFLSIKKNIFLWVPFFFSFQSVKRRPTWIM